MNWSWLYIDILIRNNYTIILIDQFDDEGEDGSDDWEPQSVHPIRIRHFPANHPEKETHEAVHRL